MFKFYPSWFVFFFMILFALVLILCGDNWFVVWLGFELSLMCFLPLLAGGLLVVEGLVNYFLVQVGGSGLFVFSFMIPFSLFSSVLFIFGMFMKLGVFPFYSWVPLVMSCLDWSGCMMVVTVQKIGPLFVLCMYAYSDFDFLVFFSVLSVVVSGVLGYNQSYMRSLMGYSSVSHTGWLVISFLFSFSLFVLYMVVYFTLVVLLFLIFSRLNLNKIVSGVLGSSYWSMVVLLLFALSGIPPFSIFYFKFCILFFLSDYYLYIPFLLLGAMLSVFYYLVFVISSLPSYWGTGFVNSRWGFFIFLCVWFFPIVFFC